MFGMLMWELFARKKPYENELGQNIKEYVKQGGRPEELSENLCPRTLKNVFISFLLLILSVYLLIFLIFEVDKGMFERKSRPPSNDGTSE